MTSVLAVFGRGHETDPLDLNQPLPSLGDASLLAMESFHLEMSHIHIAAVIMSG